MDFNRRADVIEKIRTCAARWNATLKQWGGDAILTDFKMPRPACWRVTYLAENEYRLRPTPFTEQIFEGLNSAIQAERGWGLGPIVVMGLEVRDGKEVFVDQPDRYIITGYSYAPNTRGEWRWGPLLCGADGDPSKFMTYCEAVKVR